MEHIGNKKEIPEYSDKEIEKDSCIKLQEKKRKEYV